MENVNPSPSRERPPPSWAHKRSQTLPALSPAGLPLTSSPSSPNDNTAGSTTPSEVAGLQGRLRLSRAPGSPSTVTPSAVYGSAHARAKFGGSNPPSPLSGAGLAGGPGTIGSAVGFVGEAKAIEVARKNLIAHEYLTRVAEVRGWMDSILPDTLTREHGFTGLPADFPASLQNGYYLAHLTRAIAARMDRADCRNCRRPILAPGPKGTPLELEYRHTENINTFFHLLNDEVRLPKNYHFETNDLYNLRRVPSVIFCIYALAIHCERKGIAPGIRSLRGQVEFTDDELTRTNKSLAASGPMPNFGSLAPAPPSPPPPPPEPTLEDRWREAFSDAQLADMQALIRGARAREAFDQRKHEMRRLVPAAVFLQQLTRGVLARRRLYNALDELDEGDTALVPLQAHARGMLARLRLQEMRHALKRAESSVVRTQAAIRGALTRRSLLADIRGLRRADGSGITLFQAHCRGVLARRRHQQTLTDLRHVGNVTRVQASIRGALARNKYYDRLEHLQNSEPVVVTLQAMMRGVLSRRKHDTKLAHYRSNLAAVTKIQAVVRSRVQQREYRQLRMGVNVPISTIKNFVKLLDDSEGDYRAEAELERRRMELVATIRTTGEKEERVKELDKRIALFVKNKITSEMSRATATNAFGALAAGQVDAVLAAAGDPFSAMSLNASTARKLELYQQLFWLMQTEPKYLAKLLGAARTGQDGDRQEKQLVGLTMTVFGHAQAKREEYLLLKLFQACIREEISHLASVTDFARGNFTFIKVVMQHARSSEGKRYLRQLLAPLVRKIMARGSLDFGARPVNIYRDITNEEEFQTGRQSNRPQVDTDGQAIGDDATRVRFVEQLKALRTATHEFVAAFVRDGLTSMPYGVRFVAREVQVELMRKFPNALPEEVSKVVGHLVYYRFIQPAIIAPEGFDIIEEVVPALQRTNLAEVSKMLNQISAGRVFGDAEPYLQPLNNFIRDASAAFSQFIQRVVDVKSAEVELRASKYLDAAAVDRPTVYISPNDIYSTHNLLLRNIDAIAPARDDPLRTLLGHLGGAPINTSDEVRAARAAEVALKLQTKFDTSPDSGSSDRQLLNETKQFVAAILKVQHGQDLLAVLTQDTTQQDEDAWDQIKLEQAQRRQAQNNRPRASGSMPQQHVRQPTSAGDLDRLSFFDLKGRTVENVIKLRKLGMVSSEDKYQRIIDELVQDIKNKNERRIEREAELKTVNRTIESLGEKRKYIDKQIEYYEDYISKSMTSVQKKTKKRLVLPWSLQAAHERSLNRTGKKYTFGSHKYTAQHLYDKGILLSIHQYSPRQFGGITLTISSNAVGVFEISAAALGVPVATVELMLEDLLEAQFEGRSTVAIEDIAKANLNLLIHLINKLFFS